MAQTLMQGLSMEVVMPSGNATSVRSQAALKLGERAVIIRLEPPKDCSHES
jgi:hypothetical protein